MSNPFAPGFGTPPPALAGRDEPLQRAVVALRAGPQHPMFRHAYCGVRGVGKTVLVDAIAVVARHELGWPVVSHQAIADEDLPLALLGRLPAALADARWPRARAVRHLVDELTVGVDAVVKAEARIRPGSGAAQEVTARFEAAITAVGRQAAERRRGLLLCVDEVQAAPARPGLAALARAMQSTARAGLPIAVILSGLPGLARHLADAGTFMERLPLVILGDLDADATRFALVKPAADVGVRIDDDALELLVRESSGYPYFVQLFGFWAFDAMGRRHVLRIDDARAGVAAGRGDAARSLYEPRWDRLSGLQRDYVAAAAAQDDVASTGAIAAALGRTHQQVSPVRAALIDDHHLLAAAGHGLVRFTLPGFADWVRTTRPTA
jgi:hypothetical protein